MKNALRYYGVASRRDNHRAGTASEVLAQPFPLKRITLMVPFPPRSVDTDGVTRRLAESIHDQAGVTVLVENKPGADGNLAALSVLKADADGYTVFVTTNSTHAANVNLFNAMPFDPRTDSPRSFWQCRPSSRPSRSSHQTPGADFEIAKIEKK